MVIDSHLSTRTSNKRTNAFSLSYVNGWKKIRRWIRFDVVVKKKKIHAHNLTAFFTGRSLNDSFFASFRSVFFSPALLFQYTT